MHAYIFPIFALLTAHCLAAPTGPIPAFPGAEGAGAGASGGRGGAVVFVENLQDKGEGSLRAALEKKGPRMILFRVAGIIELQKPLSVKSGDVTIAGQSAPGDGICVKNFGMSLSGARNVIVRHLRFRPGDGAGKETDSLGGTECADVIIDHCSASWSVDETVSFYNCDNLTVQWCIISESLRQSAHTKGDHGYGGIWGGRRASWHHNLLAHHSSRNPRIAQGDVGVDVRNNVIFNWGFNSIYGGEGSGVNLVANYFKPGPATQEGVRERFAEANGKAGRWFVEGNFMEGCEEISTDNWQGGVQRWWGKEAEVRATTAFPAAFTTTQSPHEAFEAVLKDAGATLPRRDAVDQRIVAETRSGEAKSGKNFNGGGNGIIDSPNDVGGWPDFSAAAPPPDADDDGMPDAWETQHGFDAQSGADGPLDHDGDGYTNLEEFLNNTDPTKFVAYTLKPDLTPQTVQPSQPGRFFRDEIRVAANGSADVTSIQAAIDLAPPRRAKPLTIRIKAGTYAEQIVIPREKSFLTLRGDGADETIVTAGKSLRDTGAEGKPITAEQSATLLVLGDDFRAEKLSIINSTGPGIQALAAYVRGDRAHFKRCTLTGYQDTLRLEQGRSWLENCTISGAVDFIYGSGTAWFEKCSLKLLGDGFIAAPSTPPDVAHGFIFHKCEITAEPAAKRVFLARPWKPHGSALFLRCRLPAAIDPAGWNNWNKPENEATARFAEYKSEGEGSDVKLRVQWARQLDKQTAELLTPDNVLAGQDGWQPKVD